MNYYLTMLSDWRFSTEDFKHRLLARWPAAVLKEEADTSSIDSLEFELPMPHRTLEGSLRRKGTGIAFDGDIRDYAEFALWVRSFVPPAERLFFCDEGMSGSLDLELDTTPSDIYRLYDYAPPPPGWMNYCLMARPRWTRPPQEFARLLRLRWPEARVETEPDTNPHRTISFQIPMSHSTVTGSLARAIPSLDFTGDARDCAEFSLWCRSVLLAKEVSLSGEWNHIILQPSTTVEDILQALAPPPSGHST